MADECSRCREELARLTEENLALRRAAITFGSLAERLNVSLQEERRARPSFEDDYLPATTSSSKHAPVTLRPPPPSRRV